MSIASSWRFDLAPRHRPSIESYKRFPNDRTALVADDLQHAGDLQRGAWLQRPGKEKHAGNEQDRHQQERDVGTTPEPSRSIQAKAKSA